MYEIFGGKRLFIRSSGIFKGGQVVYLEEDKKSWGLYNLVLMRWSHADMVLPDWSHMKMVGRR